MEDTEWEDQLNTAARNLHAEWTELGDDPQQHNETYVFRAGMGDRIDRLPDPRYLLEYTVRPVPPPLDAVTNLLRAHPFWRAFKERKPPDPRS